MNYTAEHRKQEQSDRRKSLIITLLISLLVLLCLYFYKFTPVIPETKEVVTTMLINFGDNQKGNQPEEPANQDGSLSAKPIVTPQPTPEPKSEPKPEPKKVEVTPTEKVITGKSEKKSTPKVEKVEKKKTPEKTSTKQKTRQTKTKKTETAKNTSKNTTSKTANSNQDSGDGKGNAAIGNLIRGRGNKADSQGSDGSTGNQGDPLGGDSNGTSRIGEGRNLIAFIPGTMGRGGAQPSHNCTASGTITIAYTVDKAGNVTSARRSGGTSDPCISGTSVAWVKQYVKAEKANTSSTGTYKISF